MTKTDTKKTSGKTTAPATKTKYGFMETFLYSKDAIAKQGYELGQMVDAERYIKKTMGNYATTANAYVDHLRTGDIEGVKKVIAKQKANAQGFVSDTKYIDAIKAVEKYVLDIKKAAPAVGNTGLSGRRAERPAKSVKPVKKTTPPTTL